MKAVLALVLISTALVIPTATAVPSSCEGTLVATQLDEGADEVGRIRLHATNDDRADQVLVCIYRGGLVFERVFDLPANGALDYTIPAPEGDYGVDYVMGIDQFRVTGAYYVDLASCESKRAVVPVEVTHGLVGFMMGVYSAECEAGAAPETPPDGGTLAGSGTARPLTQAGSVPAFTGTTNVGPEASLALAGLIFLAFIAHKATFPGLVALYSRLAGPKLLDQRVRREIVDLVTQEPGILLNEIAHRLELGQGSLRHHVRLLLAAGLLRETRVGRQRHLFNGPAPGLERSIVLLRRESAQRLIAAVEAAPGQPLKPLAQNAQLSLSAASKVASLLLAAKLLRRDDAAYPPRWYPARRSVNG